MHQRLLAGFRVGGMAIAVPLIYMLVEILNRNYLRLTNSILKFASKGIAHSGRNGDNLLLASYVRSHL